MRSNPTAFPTSNQPRESTNLAGRYTLSDIPSTSDAEDSENSGSLKQDGDSDGSLSHDHPAEKGNQQSLEPGNATLRSLDEELAEVIKTRQELERQVMLAKERQRISCLQHTLTRLNQAAPRERSSTTLGTAHILTTSKIPVTNLRTSQIETRTTQSRGQKCPRADTIVELASPTTDTSQLPIHAAEQVANLTMQNNYDDTKPPPRPTETERFHGKSMREYTLWVY